MIAGALIQNLRSRTDQAARNAAIQPQIDDLAGAVRASARPDIREALKPHRTHRIEIADDGGRAFHLLDDVTKLEAVEKLAMAKMHIGKRDVAKADQLRQARRHPPRQDGARQAQFGGGRKGMRAPGRKAIDSRLHGMTEKMPAHQRRQGDDVFGAFLQQQQVGVMTSHQLGDILHASTDPAQQIPAHHAQRTVGGMIGEGRRHIRP